MIDGYTKAKRMVETQPAQTKYRLLRKLVVIFFLVFILVQVFTVINQHFDLASILPLKRYQGDSFSIGYLQDWKVLVQDDTVSVEPEYNWFADFFDPPGYFGSSLYISTEKATASTSPATGVIDEKAWEINFPHYTPVKMPDTVMVGGSQWFQHVAIVATQARDGTNVSMEIMTLSTVHQTTGKAPPLFTMIFYTDPTSFDQLNGQVWQTMLRSFAFR